MAAALTDFIVYYNPGDIYAPDKGWHYYNEKLARDNDVGPFDTEDAAWCALADKLKLSFDHIDEAYQFARTEHGDLKELDWACGTNSDELIQADAERRLITMVDGDGSDVIYCIGYSRVNRLAHYELVKPIPEGLYKTRYGLHD